MGRRSRKRGRSAGAGASPPPRAPTPPAAPDAGQPRTSRRRELVVGAVVAALLGAATLAGGFLVELGGPQQASPLATILWSAMLFGTAAGMWAARYWAVLGFMTAIGLYVVFFGLLAVKATNVLAQVILVAIIVGLGAAFWCVSRTLGDLGAEQRSQLERARQRRAKNRSG